MTEKFIVADDQYYRIDGKILELKRRLRQKNGSPIDPGLVENAFQDILEGKFGILKLISGGENLTIDACNGEELIASAIHIFRLGINDEFNDPETNKSDYPTDAVDVDVYQSQMIGGLKSITLMQVTDFLDRDLESLCFNQAQIRKFCEKYSDSEWLPRDGSTTFFLLKDDPKKGSPNAKFYYAYVNNSPYDGLVISKRRFSLGAEHNISGKPSRFIVPKKIVM